MFQHPKHHFHWHTSKQRVNYDFEKIKNTMFGRYKNIDPVTFFKFECQDSKFEMCCSIFINKLTQLPVLFDWRHLEVAPISLPCKSTIFHVQRLVFANQLFSGFMGSRAFDVFSSARARSHSELCWAKMFRLFVHGKMFIYLLGKKW